MSEEVAIETTQRPGGLPGREGWQKTGGGSTTNKNSSSTNDRSIGETIKSWLAFYFFEGQALRAPKKQQDPNAPW